MVNLKRRLERHNALRAIDKDNITFYNLPKEDHEYTYKILYRWGKWLYLIGGGENLVDTTPRRRNLRFVVHLCSDTSIGYVEDKKIDESSFRCCGRRAPARFIRFVKLAEMGK